MLRQETVLVDSRQLDSALLGSLLGQRSEDSHDEYCYRLLPVLSQTFFYRAFTGLCRDSARGIGPDVGSALTRWR